MIILRSKEAKNLLHMKNFREIPTFLKQAGSNWALKEDAVQWQAQKGWRTLRQRGGSISWWAMMDLNHRPRHYQCRALTPELIARRLRPRRFYHGERDWSRLFSNRPRPERVQ